MTDRAENNAGKDRRILTADRERIALDMRRSGASYQAIADRLGYQGPSGAWKACSRALAASVREVADELRNLELARLDRMHAAVWPKAIAGNCRAVDRVLAIMARRAKLLGLDAPRRRNVSGTVTLQTLAERAAEGTDLDAGTILAEAERLLREARIDGGAS